MDARIIGISHSDSWPGVTPLNVYDLPLATWSALALTYDKQQDERRRAARERAARRPSSSGRRRR